jgi:very-short-patch-repair endonuclease
MGRGWVGERSDAFYACRVAKRIDPELTQRARDLRNNPTPAERAVWQLIHDYRPAFTRQLVLPPFIVDLACRKARLGVEFDGGHHADQMARDARRTAYLEAHGWRIIRLWNSDVLANPEGAVLHILSRTAECLGGTHPRPLPQGEGRRRRPMPRVSEPQQTSEGTCTARRSVGHRPQSRSIGSKRG